jgi:hypothetical protein
MKSGSEHSGWSGALVAKRERERRGEGYNKEYNKGTISEGNSSKKGRRDQSIINEKPKRTEY